MNLDNLNLVELNAQETKEVGGGSFFRFILTGVLDGIPNNTESHFELFGIPFLHLHIQNRRNTPTILRWNTALK